MPDHEVLVIGAGFSGIGAAIKLDEAGFPAYAVLEQSDGVGGAWHANTYPGVAVDIPSFSYQFSFAQSSRWSRVYAPGTELKSYAEHLVDRYGLRDRIRLNTAVVDAAFDDDEHHWRVTTADGDTVTARYVIGAAGVLTQPKRPDIPGLDEFAGPLVHTARWDHGLDLAGRRVGVIGTGASALQLIPTIAEQVEHLTVFQRTPIWVLPKIDLPLPGPARAALRHVPFGKALARLAGHAFVESSFVLPAHLYRDLPALVRGGEALARRLLRRQVHDPATRDKLTPRYGLGCKRPSFSNTYLRAFNRPNVTLETAVIEAVTPTGVRTAAAEHPLDVLVLATGFKVFEQGNMPPFPIRGAGGTDLEKWWDDHRYQAYHGASVPGFPNLFTILGPYGYNGTSYFQLIENQMRHIVRCLRAARGRGATRVEVTEAANDRYFAEMMRRREKQVFFHNNCGGANSYYFDRHGDVPFRPSTSIEALWRSSRFDLADYTFA